MFGRHGQRGMEGMNRDHRGGRGLPWIIATKHGATYPSSLDGCVAPCFVANVTACFLSEKLIYPDQ